MATIAITIRDDDGAERVITKTCYSARYMELHWSEMVAATAKAGGAA